MLLDEILAKHRHIIHSLPERRDVNRDDLQSVVEVGQKSSRGGEPAEIAVRRRDHPYVDAFGALGAERLELPLLEDSQQLGLEADAHQADLVEQNRSAVRQ